MKTVYILADYDDRRNIHAFQQRRNAIKYAYERCVAFGAFLSVKVWNASIRQWQYQSLRDVIGDNDPIEYLNTLNDEDVNDVFYEYYLLIETELKDV